MTQVTQVLDDSVLDDRVLDDYDVVWHTPSRSSAESMPCGGGDVGLNVWCENGDLLAYVDRSGSFDENNQMLKLGRLRLRLGDDLLATAETFRQQLVLRSGHVEVEVTRGEQRAVVTIWVEVHRPVVHVQVSARLPLLLQVSYEGWRTEPRLLDTGERMACLSFQGSTPETVPVTTHPDVVTPGPDALTWYHRNDSDDLLFDKVLLVEHLDQYADQLANPQRDLTFGGRLTGSDLLYKGSTTGRYGATPYRAWTYASAGATTQHHLQLGLATGQHADVESWERELSEPVDEERTAELWQQNVRWWREFWSRSHILVDTDTDQARPSWQVGRNYQLFRYTLACNAYGSHPTKFNGSLFTYDAEVTAQNATAERTPDFRAWGGASATAQNQRLVYFPMLRAGDFDLMTSQFEFYRRALPGAELRTRVAFDHPGASFTEQMENFGLPCLSIYDFGWGAYGVSPRPGAEIGELRNEWCRDQYDTVLEFALMVLERASYGGADVRPDLPWISSALTFFDQHYRALHRRSSGSELDEDGRLVIFPGSALETYKDARDPAPTVAALRVVTGRLLALGEEHGSADERELWRRLADSLPELPMREVEGRTTIAPAASWSKIQNVEFPQMYPVYPWGLYGVGLPDLQVARDTFAFGADEDFQHGVVGWKQDPIFVARLGQTAEAAAMLVEKLSDAPRRFPTFWGPGFDWLPDFNHGGSGSIALQEMLLQTPGRQIHVLPAWPADWDVSFRLHAPEQTVVEGRVEEGQLVSLTVTPAARRADVTVHPLRHRAGQDRAPGQDRDEADDLVAAAPQADHRDERNAR
jgi:hypothetical protein